MNKESYTIWFFRIHGIPEEIQKVFVINRYFGKDHVYAQSVWQQFIDNAIAKTINMPHDD